MYKIPKISNATAADHAHFEQMNKRAPEYGSWNLLCAHELTKISHKYRDFTDKGPTSSYWRKHVYTEFYGPLFSHLVEKENLRVLEIGTKEGGSILMWAEFFKHATVYGVDLNLNQVPPEAKGMIEKKENIKLIAGNAYDNAFFDKNISNLEKFDIILDDGSHREEDQIVFFEMYGKMIKPGGFLLCEDFVTLDQARRVATKFDGRLNNTSIIIRNHCIPSGKGEIIVMYKE